MYLSRLSKLSEGKQDPQKVVICSEKELMGLCYQVQSENQELGEWSTKVQSLYVPGKFLFVFIILYSKLVVENLFFIVFYLFFIPFYLIFFLISKKF